MFDKFLPSAYVESIFEIDPKGLQEKGIKGIITDLDNTLVAWDEANATPEVIEWLKLMDQHGIKVTIISNNSWNRVEIFSEPLKVPFIGSAKKPLTRAFKRGALLMGLKKEDVVVIGDQLLTDIFGGNRAGFHTILVLPIVESDAAITQFNRRIERKILNRLRRQGKIDWEE